MDEVCYFTNRDLAEGGHARAWVFKERCPKCGKGLMGKPVEKGKVKMRAKEYVCPECSYSVDKEEYEPTLTLCVAYTCPSCGKDGETTGMYKRKTIKGVPTYRVQCTDCGANIDITKKMKEKKD